jgi:integrase
VPTSSGRRVTSTFRRCGKERGQVSMSTNAFVAKDARRSPATQSFSTYRPYWFKEGSYDSLRWVVRDDNPLSPNPARLIYFDIPVYDSLRPGERCRLTDPEYAHLLDTIRRIGYGVRTGKHATISTAQAQMQVVHSLITQVSWMILHNIRRFSDLSEEDFEEYAQKSAFGTAHLLMYTARIDDHIKALKDKNCEIPSVSRGARKKRRLDMKTLLEGIGIDHERALLDSNSSLVLLKLAHGEGFYLLPSQVKRLGELPKKPGRQSATRVRHYLVAWDYLWRMRHALDDRLQFNPFREVSLIQTAKELGRPAGRTKTAPVRQTMELIDCCLHWVLNYAPLLLDIRDQYDAVFSEFQYYSPRLRRLEEIISKVVFPNGPGTPVSLVPSSRYFPSKGIDFETAVNKFIPVACLVVICVFTGRRLSEAWSIRADCLTRDGQGWWLETYIEKTVQVWDKTPCNEAVVAAVEILKRWSAPARAISGEAGLFQFKQFGKSRVIHSDHTSEFFKFLRRFVEFLPISPMPDGSRWRFTPHQFRRFFAIMFFWRYRFSDLAALSYHLRHLNPAMTLRYVTEAETGAIFREAGKEYTTTVLTEGALGERNISAGFGERFKTAARKLRRHFRRAVKVVTPELARRLVERYVDRSKRRLTPMEWGDCACGTLPHQLNTAKCLEHVKSQTRFGPDFSNSSPAVCATCPHHVTEPLFESFLRKEITSNDQTAADLRNGPLLLEASRQLARTLTRHCERSFENSRPLEVLDD